MHEKAWRHNMQYFKDKKKQRWIKEDVAIIACLIERFFPSITSAFAQFFSCNIFFISWLVNSTTLLLCKFLFQGTLVRTLPLGGCLLILLDCYTQCGIRIHKKYNHNRYHAILSIPSILVWMPSNQSLHFELWLTLDIFITFWIKLVYFSN